MLNALPAESGMPVSVSCSGIIIKLPCMVDCDEGPTALSALDAHLSAVFEHSVLHSSSRAVGGLDSTGHVGALTERNQ